MLGVLPTSLQIGDRNVPMNTDFRFALLCFQAFNDPDLSDQEKVYIMVDTLLGEENIFPEEAEEAIEKCVWFLDGGKQYEQSAQKRRMIDWEQDEQLIFSAVNDVARCETRMQKYLHWWTFLGYFNEIREGLFSSVLLIRQKKAKGKELTKYEREFYAKNKEMIDLKLRFSEEEQKEVDRLNELLDS